MSTNARSSRTKHLSARLVLGFLGAAALASVACGGDDYYGLDQQPSTTGDGGRTGEADSSTTASSDASTTTNGDATTGDATAPGSHDSGSTDGGTGITTDGSPITIVISADGGVCNAVNGVFSLNAPSAGSSALCPTQSVLCSFATTLPNCEVVTQCVEPDGGVSALSLFSIPTEVLGPNNNLAYDASVPLPPVLGVDAGSLGFTCNADFGDDSVTVGVSCKATVPVVGTVDVCTYVGLPIDGGL